MIKTRLLIFIFFSFFLNFSCQSKFYEIYEKYPKGLYLNKQLIKSSSQIYKYKEFKFLVQPRRVTEFKTLYYLLQFGEDNKLKGSCFIAFSGIFEINQKKIQHLKSSFNSDTNYCFCDLASGYELKAIEETKGNGGSRNKMILNFDTFFDKDIPMIKLEYFEGIQSFYSKNELSSIQYHSTNTLTIELNKLHKNEQGIYLIGKNAKHNTIMKDHFLFRDKKQRQLFLNAYVEFYM